MHHECLLEEEMVVDVHFVKNDENAMKVWNHCNFHYGNTKL